MERTGSGSYDADEYELEFIQNHELIRHFIGLAKVDDSGLTLHLISTYLAMRHAIISAHAPYLRPPIKEEINIHLFFNIPTEISEAFSLFLCIIV